MAGTHILDHAMDELFLTPRAMIVIKRRDEDAFLGPWKMVSLTRSGFCTTSATHNSAHGIFGDSAFLVYWWTLAVGIVSVIEGYVHDGVTASKGKDLELVLFSVLVEDYSCCAMSDQL